MQRDDVGLGQRVHEARRQADARRVGALGGQVRAPGDDVHPERRATAATRVPILPSPTSASVAPARSRPTVDCHGPPLAKGGRLRDEVPGQPEDQRPGQLDRRGRALAVPQTVIPRSRQAARSIEALRIPQVTTSRRRGQPVEQSAGERGALAHHDEDLGVADGRDHGVLVGEVLAHRGRPSTPGSTDQSAYDVATPW